MDEEKRKELPKLFQKMGLVKNGPQFVKDAHATISKGLDTLERLYNLLQTQDFPPQERPRLLSMATQQMDSIGTLLESLQESSAIDTADYETRLTLMRQQFTESAKHLGVNHQKPSNPDPAF